MNKMETTIQCCGMLLQPVIKATETLYFYYECEKCGTGFELKIYKR